MAITTDGASKDPAGGSGIPVAEKGAANGVCPLDAGGLVATSDLPSGIGFAPYAFKIGPGWEWVAQTNWNNVLQVSTYAPYANDGGPVRRLDTVSSALNNLVDFNVGMAAGTWTIRIAYTKVNNAGIVTVYLDGVSLGTIDMYAASVSSGNIAEFAGVAVASSGNHILRLKTTGQNGSSIGYHGYFEQATGVRTGS